MLDAIIMNFGDSNRVFYDFERKPVTIEVGATTEITLDDHTATYLTNAQKNDSILVMRKHVDFPPELLKMLDIVREIATLDYDDALTRANALLGAKGFGVTRPSRQLISITLRDQVTEHCNVTLNRTKPVPKAVPVRDPDDLDNLNLRDDVNPKTLKKEAERAPKARTTKKAKAKRARIRIEH